MHTSRTGVVVGIALVAVMLTGCSAPTPAVTVTAAPLPPATVTATPEPMAGDTPLDKLGAWTACAGFLMTYSGSRMIGAKLPSQSDYDPALVTQSGSAFTVYLVGGVGAPGFHCTVSGTYGAPLVTDWITQK